MKYTLVYLGILLVIVMGLAGVSAQAVKSITTVERGVDIVHPETPYVKLGEDLEINFWTYNSSDGSTMTNLTLNCTLYIINDKGVNFFRFSNQAGASGLMTYGKGAPLCINCWTMVLGAGNLTNGLYSYQIKCQRDGLGGYETGMFEVTPTGTKIDSATATMYILLFVIMLFIFLLCGYFTMAIEGDNIRNQDGNIIQINYKKYFRWLTFAITYISFVSMIYFAWNMSYAFVTFDSLARFFKWLFFISFGLMWPVLIVSAIYMISKWLMDSKINEMLERGLTPRKL
jgi:hypothetical protein